MHHVETGKSENHLYKRAFSIWRRALQDSFVSASPNRTQLGLFPTATMDSSSTNVTVSPSDAVNAASTGGATVGDSGGKSIANSTGTTPNSTAVDFSPLLSGCTHCARQDLGLNENAASYPFTGM